MGTEATSRISEKGNFGEGHAAHPAVEQQGGNQDCVERHQVLHDGHDEGLRWLAVLALRTSSAVLPKQVRAPVAVTSPDASPPSPRHRHAL